MQLYLRLAWRNIWRHTRRTVIVVLAIGLTTAMMMMYDGLITGFENAIYGNAIKVLGGNVQVHALGYSDKADELPLLPLPEDQAVVQAAKALPQVIAAGRRINTGGMATSPEGAFAVKIVGLEPEAELAVSLPAQNITAGRYLQTGDLDNVVVGKGLAEAMGLNVGDRLTLVGRATHSQMRQRTMTIVGVYDIGMASIERGTVYMSLAEAQDLYGLTGQVTEVAVYLQLLGQEDAVAAALKPQLQGAEVASWRTSFPELATAVSAKSGVMNVFSVIILMISGIGILNLLLMAVYERRREIGLLGALGMKPRQISWLFLLEGAMLGLVGVAAGVVLGLAFNFVFGQVGMDYSKYTDLAEYTALITGRVYPTLGVERLAQRVVTALVITVLASFYPAREAARNEPAHTLHAV
jgi:ABC-type lipoprotein release transport system permease subunit